MPINVAVAAVAALGLALLVVAAPPALATTYDVTDSEQGSINSGSGTAADYLVGNCSSCSAGDGAYAAYFGFAIPTLDGSVTSVTLEINSGNVDLAQSLTMDVDFFSLDTTTSFSAIGSGSLYAAFGYDSSDAGAVEDIALDAGAIFGVGNDAGGTFLIGALNVTPATVYGADQPNEYVYCGTAAISTTLVITTSGNGGTVGNSGSSGSVGSGACTVPEPASIVLVAGNLLGLRLVRRRRRRAA
jgi:hypothetical protein